MDIREYKEYQEEEIQRLYTEVGWSAYTENMPALKQGYKNSLLVLAAYENEELLGIIRVVGDGCTIVFIQDIRVCERISVNRISCDMFFCQMVQMISSSGRLAVA